MTAVLMSIHIPRVILWLFHDGIGVPVGYFKGAPNDGRFK